MDGIPFFRWRPRLPPMIRRFALMLISAVSLLFLLRAYCVEPFQVPTGSMAPALLGHHRSVACPCCGIEVDVGRARADHDGTGGTSCYDGVSCPNCGCPEIPLGRATETRGDHVLVNKLIYNLRRPRRWEIVVFRRFGKVYIKRLIGLAGEQIELAEGDVYIDGALARKTFEEFLGMQVLLFDNDFAPPGASGLERWEAQPSHRKVTSSLLTLDGRETPHQLIYRTYSRAEAKCRLMDDEYAYNGSQGCAETVHDFMVEADVEVVAGRGALKIALTDGGIEAEVQLAVGVANQLMVRLTPPGPPFVRGGDGVTKLPVGKRGELQKVQLLVGKHYHIDMALVDRRLTVRVDGRDLFDPLDLPSAKDRPGVERPLRFESNGVLARLRHVRLYRDVHYTQLGSNAVHGRTVRLGVNQSFVLGDNSANSEDSRFWRGDGAVPLEDFIGRAFLVHLPSRATTWQAGGRLWQCQLPDLERVRWLK